MEDESHKAELLKILEDLKALTLGLKHFSKTYST